MDVLSLDDFVHPFNSQNFFQEAGDGKCAKYLLCYLTALNAESFIVEPEYIDKSFLIDFQKFYCRSFNPCKNSTKRIHFFNKEINAQSLSEALKGEKNLNEEYLGFIVIKPIVNTDNKPIIGRTLLKTYPLNEGKKIRHYITKKYNVCLFGIQLTIESIPFQEQDFGVSACATVALWSTLKAIPASFDVLSYSPSEITQLSNEFPGPFRVFPQVEGLSLDQILACIRYVGLDIEYIKPNGNSLMIETAVKSYIDCGLPLIAILDFSEDEHHAVVITGYQTNENGHITEFYTHDDQIGPYNWVKPNPDFLKWDNEWSQDYEKIQLGELIIPIYHKIRLPFYKIFSHYEYKKNGIPKNWRVELFLTTVQKYKNSLLVEDIKHKHEHLTNNLPKFIWVERFYDDPNQKQIQDDLFDGTAIYLNKISEIEYIDKSEENVP